MRTEALFMLSFMAAIGVVSYVYFYIKEKKEARVKNKKKHAE